MKRIGNGLTGFFISKELISLKYTLRYVWIKVGVFSAIVTPITAAEVLVKPLKKGQMSIADKYRNAIRNMPNISNIKFDVEIGFMAGSLRAKYGLPLPDMLQVAAALGQPANAIITNDRDIQRVRETNVFLLSDLATWYLDFHESEARPTGEN